MKLRPPLPNVPQVRRRQPHLHRHHRELPRGFLSFSSPPSESFSTSPSSSSLLLASSSISPWTPTAITNGHRDPRVRRTSTSGAAASQRQGQRDCGAQRGLWHLQLALVLLGSLHAAGLRHLAQVWRRPAPAPAPGGGGGGNYKANFILLNTMSIIIQLALRQHFIVLVHANVYFGKTHRRPLKKMRQRKDALSS